MFVDAGGHLVVSGNLDRAHVFGKLDVAVTAPRMRAVGYVAEEHMAPLMAGAEAFLFPSLYEGFGMPIIEAMACATPVLTSAATATQEVAMDKALLVDPKSVDTHDSAFDKQIAGYFEPDKYPTITFVSTSVGGSI